MCFCVLFVCCFFCSYWTTYGILVPQPGIWSMSPAVEAQNLNHLTTREEGNFLLLECLQEEKGSVSSVCYSTALNSLSAPFPWEGPDHTRTQEIQGELSPSIRTEVMMPQDGRNLDPWITRWRTAFANPPEALCEQKTNLCDIRSLRFQVLPILTASINNPIKDDFNIHWTNLYEK